MAGGKAHGSSRQYQIDCRNVLLALDSNLSPWPGGDGIDVPFLVRGSEWSVDIALCRSDGKVVLAECKCKGGIKQSELAPFAYVVEGIRQKLNVEVAGIFVAKDRLQIGAIRVADDAGITLLCLEEGVAPRGFNTVYCRYDRKREKGLRDITMRALPGAYEMSGGEAELIHRDATGVEHTDDQR